MDTRPFSLIFFNVPGYEAILMACYLAEEVGTQAPNQNYTGVSTVSTLERSVTYISQLRLVYHHTAEGCVILVY